MSDEKLFLTSKEAAQILAIHPRTLVRWRQAGIIQTYQLGKTLVFDKKELEDLLLKRTTPTLVTTEELK
jgi:excisionase family DNA binding protein